MRWIFALILSGACLGLFGGGPLSWNEVEAGGFRVEHERFLRARSSIMVIAKARGERTRVVVDGLFQPHDVVRVDPVPLVEQVFRDCRVVEVASHAGEDVAVRLEWQPRAAGLRRGRVGVDESLADVWAFVYP